MNWYKNAKTATKLMLAFGLLAAIMGIVGWQGIRAAGTLSNMLDVMYERHMIGSEAILEAKAQLGIIGREVRQAILAPDSVSKEQSNRALLEQFDLMEQSLATAEKSVVTEEGKTIMARLRRNESVYRTMQTEAARLAVNHQDKAAMEQLAAVRPIGDAMRADCAAIQKIKGDLGKQAYSDGATVFLSLEHTLIAIIVGSAALAIGLGFFIARLIGRPLAHTVDVLQAVGNRDLTRSLSVDTKDEVGEMAQALNQAVSEIREALGEVRVASEGVASAAEQLAASSEQLSSGTQEQASSQEETSASLQELSTAVKQNAENARQASQLASGARDTADKGGAAVNTAVAAMAEINAASKRIADIITAIDEIAFQTNLLALNAAVEAARAGEQGRGFAVVAAEVRSLAQRSATAAKEIKSLIQDSVRKVETGSDLVNRSGQTLTEIVTSVKRVTDIVAEIAAASREQSVGIEQVTKAMAQMDQVTQTNSAQTEQLATTSQTLAAHAVQLQTLVGRFVLGQGAKREAAATRPPAKTTGRATQSLARLSRHTALTPVVPEPDPAGVSTFDEF
ncbi:MAG TPA: methyl-accepting chemotaxis protein [Bryobacteraceae bacterium]|nr:methyl-accepting chemotaxis protein [Bryobacteraceae bacterium]